MTRASDHRHLLFFLSVAGSLIVGGIIVAGAGPAETAGAAPELACPSASCTDYNPCTVDSCDTSTGTCRHDPLSCDDSNSCTDDYCNPQFGCAHANRPAGSSCDDGSPCSLNDTCRSVSGGPSQCVGDLLPAGTFCDDGNSCTLDETCTAEGACTGGSALPDGFDCDDGNPCTFADVCALDPAGSVPRRTGRAPLWMETGRTWALSSPRCRIRRRRWSAWRAAFRSGISRGARWC